MIQTRLNLWIFTDNKHLHYYTSIVGITQRVCYQSYFKKKKKEIEMNLYFNRDPEHTNHINLGLSKPKEAFTQAL